MSKIKGQPVKPKPADSPSKGKKSYVKPKIKTVKIEASEVFATDNCGGSGY